MYMKYRKDQLNERNLHTYNYTHIIVQTQMQYTLDTKVIKMQGI